MEEREREKEEKKFEFQLLDEGAGHHGRWNLEEKKEVKTVDGWN